MIAVMVVLTRIRPGEVGAIWLAGHDVLFSVAARAESGVDTICFLIKGGGGQG